MTKSTMFFQVAAALAALAAFTVATAILAESTAVAAVNTALSIAFGMVAGHNFGRGVAVRRRGQ